MACFGNIAADLGMPCGAPASADMGRPVSAKILNASDIASFTVTAGTATITRKVGSVGYDVTAINNALTVTVGLKSQDIVPGAYDVSITFKNFSVTQTEVTSSPMGVVNGLSRAELVIAVDHGNGKIRVYGLGAPLVCTELVGDSTASEYYTFTYGVEDWQVGTTVHGMSRADYDALSTSQPAPKPKG
nr:MAG: hypothetical protein [Bacteriophage sp.]